MQIKQTQEDITASRVAAHKALNDIPQEATVNIAGLQRVSPATQQRLVGRVLAYFTLFIIIGLIAGLVARMAWPEIVTVVFAVVVAAGVLLANRGVRQLLGILPEQTADNNLIKFVQDNNWTYAGKTPLPPTDFIPAINSIGTHQQISQAFYGTWINHPFVSYLATAYLPLQSSEGRYAVRVFKISFNKDALLPHTVVSVHQTTEQKTQSVIPRHFEQTQRLALESAFEQNFTVYGRAATKADVLSFLAPNVLETIIATNKLFDIELVGNELYLYSRDTQATPEAITSALTVLATLTRHIEHRLRSWKFVLPNDQYPYLISEAGYGTTTIGDKKFNFKYIILLSAYALVLVRIWGQSGQDTDEKMILTIIISVIFVVGVAVTAWLAHRKKT